MGFNQHVYKTLLWNVRWLFFHITVSARHVQSFFYIMCSQTFTERGKKKRKKATKELKWTVVRHLAISFSISMTILNTCNVLTAPDWSQQNHLLQCLANAVDGFRPLPSACTGHYVAKQPLLTQSTVSDYHLGQKGLVNYCATPLPPTASPTGLTLIILMLQHVLQTQLCNPVALVNQTVLCRTLRHPYSVSSVSMQGLLSAGI